MISFVFILLLAFCLLPLPIPARPTTHMLLARQNYSESTRMDVDLFFGIIFSLALLFALLGSFAWLATGRTVAQLFESLNRMCAASIALTRRLSDFRFSSLFERAATTILDATDAGTANTPRRGGASYPVATVPRGRMQSGRPGRLAGPQGGGSPLAFAPST
ncbi:hypothetical protein BJY52DRAFT_1289966 [Lactarius psammicola]|nr:hypothetical protein BJY52DRAFT_1289966 [Lactarius psammicola]